MEFSSLTRSKIDIFSQKQLCDAIFSAGSLGARHSIPERIFLRGSFGFCMPGSYAVYVRAAGLQLQIPLPSVLQERFPGSVVEFREILLRKDSVIEKAEYRQSIAGAVQTVILTTYIFVECLYALIYFQIFLMAGLRFSSCRSRLSFARKVQHSRSKARLMSVRAIFFWLLSNSTIQLTEIMFFRTPK